MQALVSLTPSYLVFAASVSSLPTGTARTSFSLSAKAWRKEVGTLPTLAPYPRAKAVLGFRGFGFGPVKRNGILL